jgi:hypothetical protein
MSRILLYAAFSLLTACSTSGPINKLSVGARADVGKLSAAYQAFAASSAALSAARIRADADYQAKLQTLAAEEDFVILTEQLAEHPNLRLQSDLAAGQASLRKAFLDPPSNAAIAAEAAAALVKVDAPAAALAEVGAGLKQLERERSAVEALFAYARFYAETLALIEDGLEEGRAYREKLLAAPAAAAN